MNATKVTARTAELRLAPPNSLKLATCAALSLLITLATASVISQATGAASFAPTTLSAATLTASLR
jgi:hypothetical protein